MGTSVGETATEVSVVMPCLNEAETLQRCIEKAKAALERHASSWEVVVADNGSTDGSQDIAQRAGARVVPVSAKGYGNALRSGIEAARGRYVIMGDSDDSYDFSAIEPFISKLREGYDLVMGSRLRGHIMPGAMPWKHRWIGNPVLTGIGRLFFHCPVSDFHCGLRGFSKEAYERLEVVTTGMEFASEMVIKASLKGLAISEVPITLYKDGRSRPPHLRSWSDGWRHLRFMLLHSPGWLFMAPGLALLLLALTGFSLLLPGPKAAMGIVLDVHTLVLCAAAWLIGFQLISFGVLARAFAASEGLLPLTGPLKWLQRRFSLEHSVLAGLLIALGGAALYLAAFVQWYHAAFGGLNYAHTMRLVIPASVLLAWGAQVMFGSFFLSVMQLERTRDHSSPIGAAAE